MTIKPAAIAIVAIWCFFALVCALRRKARESLADREEKRIIAQECLQHAANYDARAAEAEAAGNAEAASGYARKARIQRRLARGYGAR